MKRLLQLSLLLIPLTLVTSTTVDAGWGNGSCAWSGTIPLVHQTTEPRFKWVKAKSGKTAFLFRYGKKSGRYTYETGEYRPYGASSGKLNDPRNLPKKAPLPPGVKATKSIPVEQSTVPNFGADYSKLKHTSKPTYNHSKYGEISKELAHELLTEGKLIDDSAKLRLTVWDPTAPNCPVTKDFASAPELAPFKDKVLFQSYKPDDPMTNGLGFNFSAFPAIYFQTPTGKVLHRQNDYVGGPAALAAGLRKADPTYDPKKDPDLRKDTPWKLPFELPEGITPVHLVLGGGVLLALFSLKGNKK